MEKVKGQKPESGQVHQRLKVSKRLKMRLDKGMLRPDGEAS